MVAIFFQIRFIGPVPYFLAIFLLLTAPISVEAREHFTRTQLLMWDIPVTIEIEASGAKTESAYQAMEKAFQEARQIESLVSEWRPGSGASLLNQNPGKWVPVSKEMMEILETARQVSEWTAGAFDVTFASYPFRGRYRSPPERSPSDNSMFDRSLRSAGRSKSVPADTRSLSINNPITYRDVELIPELSLARLKRRGVKIGVSGIAKGYIVDQMSKVLKKERFRKYLINAGDIYASGSWRVGIRDPQNSGDPICNLVAKDRAVSTSGLYERGPHIVDPRTRIIPLYFQSVTIIARSSVLADALATGAFVWGPDHLKELSGKVSGIGIIFIGSDGTVGTVGRVSARRRR